MSADRTSHQPRSIRKVVVASLIGTSLEWYDFFLYGSAAALVFNKLFFPDADPLTGTLLAFATSATGFVARPIGGVVFGHYGDKLGRKTVLVVTLLVMGIATFLIGLLPTYAAIGVAAPILLVVLRIVQGLGLGGEWGGAVLMSLEHGQPDRRGWNASWPQVGVPAGNLLAAGVLGIMSALLSDAAFESWGWRVPFLLSGVLIVVGLWIRLTIAETPLFQELEQEDTKARAPILDVLKVYPRSVLTALGARLGVDIAFYTFALFILVYVAEQLDLPRSTALNAVLVGSAFQLFLIPFFGHLSDRYGRRPVYLAGALGAAVWCSSSSRCWIPGQPSSSWSPRSAGCCSTRPCTGRRRRSSPSCSRPGSATAAPRSATSSPGCSAAPWPRSSPSPCSSGSTPPCPSPSTSSAAC
jgi:MFS family permease